MVHHLIARDCGLPCYGASLLEQNDCQFAQSKGFRPVPKNQNLTDALEQQGRPGSSAEGGSQETTNRALVALFGRIAERKKATPARIALAWLIAQKRTAKRHCPEENMGVPRADCPPIFGRSTTLVEDHGARGSLSGRTEGDGRKASINRHHALNLRCPLDPD